MIGRGAETEILIKDKKLYLYPVSTGAGGKFPPNTRKVDQKLLVFKAKASRKGICL